MRNACLHCGEAMTPAGHDPCIADLPGVYFACCGHGGEAGFGGREDWSIPYLVEKGQTLYGYPAIERIRELGGDPPDFNAVLVMERMGGVEQAKRYGLTLEEVS